jgi:tetratricopeptide (TPR) repeat protein
MDLERPATVAKSIRLLQFCSILALLYLVFPLCSQSQSQRKPELIRDTESADNSETSKAPKPKEFNPLLASQNVDIGNFYFKKKNYDAAIQRYLLALEYDPKSVQACEALAKAYEKNGNIPKAVSTYKDFLQKNPDSPKIAEFRTKAEKLEKTLDNK